MATFRSGRFLCLAALFLAACAEPETPSALPRVDIEEMNVSFDFHEPLTLRASQDEALLVGASTRMQVQTRAYGASGKPAQPDGVGAWEMPAGVAARVRDGRSCAPLEDPSVYVPIDFSATARCDLVLDPSGRVVLWAVGIGRPFESLPFLQSQILVLEEDRYHVFAYVLPFPEADATVRWIAETFDERHPNMSALIWGNKSFAILADEVKGALSREIDSPSAEVREAMEKLRAVAFSVAPSRALQDR